MHSPPSRPERGDPADADRTVQGTLEAFERVRFNVEGDPSAGTSSDRRASGPYGVSRQSSIYAFSSRPPGSSGAEPTRAGPEISHAIEGFALEMAMERIALSEASKGVLRDELVITIARECLLPVEHLDMVDAYVTDLELEGKLLRVADFVVTASEEAADLLSSGLEPDRFLELYRRRHRSNGGGRGT